MASLKVADLMTEKVVFCREFESLEVAYDAMAEHSIRHIPVVDSNQEIIGLISHRDIVGAVLFSKDSLPISQLKDYMRNTRVSEVMSRGVETTEPEEQLQDAGLKMLENKFGCLPVLEGQKLIGILTESDFVRYLCFHKMKSRQRLRRHLKTA